MSTAKTRNKETFKEISMIYYTDKLDDEDISCYKGKVGIRPVARSKEKQRLRSIRSSIKCNSNF